MQKIYFVLASCLPSRSNPIFFLPTFYRYNADETTAIFFPATSFSPLPPSLICTHSVLFSLNNHLAKPSSRTPMSLSFSLFNDSNLFLLFCCLHFLCLCSIRSLSFRSIARILFCLFHISTQSTKNAAMIINLIQTAIHR